MNFRKLFGFRNQAEPAPQENEQFVPQAWDVNSLDASNNVLVAAIANLLANVLASSQPMRDGQEASEAERNRAIVGAPPPLFSGDPWIDYRSWLRIVVHGLLLDGKVWFLESNGGYRLGTVALGTGSVQPNDVSFTPIASVFDPSPLAIVAPVNRLGVIQTVGSRGTPVALLGESAKVSCLAYQRLLAIVGEKIKKEPTVPYYIATDSAALTDSGSSVTIREAVTKEGDKTVDTAGAFGKVSPLATLKEVKALESLDRKLTESLSAYLTTVLNTLGIPKEVFNTHVSHTGTVHGEIMTQFVRMGVQPFADTIIGGINAYHRRRSQRPTLWTHRPNTPNTCLLYTSPSPRD